MSAAVKPLRPAELVAITPARPRMPAMCHDCAFHPDGSPEQDDAGGKWYSILAAVDRGAPFFCHQGMPMDGDEYRPAVGTDGVPVDARVCAGWIAMRARFFSVRRADLLDDMAAAREESPLTLRVVFEALGRSPS